MRNYLIVGPAWVGDMVMAQSLFITLKKLYPDCSIDVIAPAWSLPILERMPEVNTGIALSAPHGSLSLLARWRLGRQLRKKKYSHAIVLPRSWKSALIPFFAGAAVRTGYRGEMRYGLLNDIRALDKNCLTQTVQRFVAHAYKKLPALSDELEIPFPVLQPSQQDNAQLLQRLGLNLQRPVIAMMPGAEYGPAKQWPIQYYAELASLLVKSGYQVWVFGSAKEIPIGEKIISGIEANAVNLAGKTRLIEAVDLINCAQQAVSNDSGLMHVAAALKVKVHAIYGSSTPDYTPPLADDQHKKIYYLGLDCSPCFKRVCPLGHTNCLNNIRVSDVYAAIQQS